MNLLSHWKSALAAALLLTAAGRAVMSALSPARTLPGARELQAFVQARPPVPVVFTSRTEAASFQAAAQEGEEFTYPGTISWAAREGRLRLIDTGGTVYELTWGRSLPDGSTLIDVMSPSVSLDGRRVLFAGRKAPPDPGRWRIYQIDLDGGGLRQLTGGPDDPGCVALPPLRFAADGARIPDEDRRRLDYDDIDPTDLGAGSFAFASSRLPDLGRDHARRATNVWVWPAGERAPSPLSANRNNDRWPFLLAADMLVYSHWSRNREAVTADRGDVRPVSEGGTYAAPAERWMAARVMPNGTQFGYAVKGQAPVWRPRPLFNGRLAFMTDGPGGALRVAQADWGYIEVGDDPAGPGRARLVFGPDRDADGRELTAGCPSPCPGGRVLFAAAPAGAAPGGYGLYSVPDDWSGEMPVPQRIFDDPALVDAEPVAVYPRAITASTHVAAPLADDYPRPDKLRLTGGREYTGPAGYLENLAVRDAIRSPIPWQPARPGLRADPRQNPLVPPPPNVTAIAFYAAHRDRFDDPRVPRVHGGWERLMVVPLDAEGMLRAWLPSDPLMPTVLAGLDADGKVARWAGGRAVTYDALAGDHYSGTRAGGYHYCNGCHAGHTYTSLDPRERLQ